MSKKETDILLIRKYLNGELDARAMHQLEKRAQDDPFLMDALEGYEKAQTDQQANLEDISSRLEHRVTPKQKRIIPYRTLAIAAYVLIVLTVGWLWLSNDYKERPQTAAKIIEPMAKLAPPNPAVADTAANNQIAGNIAEAPVKHHKRALTASPSKEVVVGDKAHADNMIASAEPVAAKPDTASEDTTPLNEMVVMDYTSKQKKDTKENLQAAEVNKAKSLPPAPAEQAVQSKVAGVTKTPAGSPFSAPQSKIILQGRIVDKTDGSALPGVSVRVPGTTLGAVTDNNGKFSIPVDSNKSSIVIAYIGYNTLKINARNGDSLKTIALQPNNQSLSEVVVANYKSKDESGEAPAVVAAHPQAGWHSFKKYLNANAVSPDGKTGTVKLSFMVDSSGGVSEVKVLKGLSPATNKKAIDLINNGPEWIGSSNSKTELVKVRVKFVAK